MIEQLQILLHDNNGAFRVQVRLEGDATAFHGIIHSVDNVGVIIADERAPKSMRAVPWSRVAALGWSVP